LIFFPPKLFGSLEKENLSEQKKIGGKKINLAKKFFNIVKTIFPFEKSEIILIGKVSRSIDFSSLFYAFALSRFETLHSMKNLAVSVSENLNLTNAQGTSCIQQLLFL
jgi:hypothetical protein